MFDTHVHTKFSTDSKLQIEEAINRAGELNIGLVVTEHMDLNVLEEDKYKFDVEKYFKDYSKFRNDKLLLGIEMGMTEDCIEGNLKLHKEHPFDYIIGSVHFVNNIDLFDKEFYKDKNKKEAYEDYLYSMINSVKNYDFIDSLGHIDYISRYAPFEDKEIYYKDHSDLIDCILKILAEREKALEINSRRLHNKETVNNLMNIYKRFYELGGRLVTIGSDSHNSKDIGKNFDVSNYIAESCKLKIVYFKERKPHYIKV